MKKKIRYIDDIGEGFSTEQIDALKRVFQGMEVIDSTFNLPLNVKDEDWNGARPNNVEDCVFARTSTRMFDGGAMVFLRTVAYVDLPCEDGVRRVHRFIISTKMRTQILALDDSARTGIPPEVVLGTFNLLAPSPSNTMDKRLGYRKKSRQKDPKAREKQKRYERNRKALIKSKARKVKTKSNAGVPVKRNGVTSIFRSGTGLIQTTIVK